MRISVLAGLPLALLACSSSSKKNPVIIDGPPVDIDAPAAECFAMADYGTPTVTMTQAVKECVVNNALAKCPTATTPPDFMDYAAQLDAADDILDIQLYKGAAPFTNAIGPASNINLADPVQSQFASCGACVRIFAQVDAQNNDKGVYMAQSGTLNITAVTPNITGTLTNVTFVHVQIDQTSFMSTPDPDGCPSAITGHNFDTLVMDPMAFKNDGKVMHVRELKF